MKIVIFIFIYLLFWPNMALAEMQYMYNPGTNHRIDDPTSRSKVEVLKTLGKETEANQYQLLQLTPEQENLVRQKKICVVIEDGMLAIKTIIPVITEEQQAAQAFNNLILTEFPQITDPKELTPEMVDAYLVTHPLDKDLLAKFMKAFLFYSKSKER